MLLKTEGITDQQVRKAIWLTVYSDIVTNLMLFFLILYASTRLSAEQTSQVIESMETTFVSVSERSKKVKVAEAQQEARQDLRALAEELKKLGIRMVEDKEGVTLQLPSADFFDSGRAELKPKMRKLLDLIGPPLQKYPHTISIEGHTDSMPIGPNSPFLSNWELSFARSQSVMNYLISTLHVDPKKLAAIGRSSYRPLVPNNTPENRAQNRRTEIRFLAAEVKP